VAVSGTPPFSYQWSKNGQAVSGANDATYTTPAVELGDNGDQYTVTVSNSVNSVTSAPATLTVGPRSPMPGDLRFKLIASQALDQWTDDGPASLQFTFQPAFSNAFASPLQIGDQSCFPAQPYPNCAWTFDVFSLPSGGMPLSVSFKAGYLANFESDLQTLNAPDTVIQTLDFQPVSGAYGSEWLTIQGGQFDLIERVVAPGMITSTVASDAAQSRVITAVSFDASGQAHLMSYGWQGDTTTVYDTEVAIVTPQDVVDTAGNLAGAGFMITGFGGDDTDGYVLVGTKVHGDSLPRALQAYPQSNLGGRGWVDVARLLWQEYSASGSETSNGYEYISEQ
jgi:Immunoglobulin domain